MKRLLSLLLVLAMLFSVCTVFTACDSTSVSDKDEDEDDKKKDDKGDNEENEDDEDGDSEDEDDQPDEKPAEKAKLVLILKGLSVFLPDSFWKDSGYVDGEYSSAIFINDRYTIYITSGPLSSMYGATDAEGVRDYYVAQLDPDTEGMNYGIKNDTPYLCLSNANRNSAMAWAYYVDRDYSWNVQISTNDDCKAFSAEEMINLVTGWTHQDPDTIDNTYPTYITVPDLTGVSLADANKYTDFLTEEGPWVYSDEYEKGEIISQSPEANTLIEKWSAVTVTVSMGPAPRVTMENFATGGYTLDVAQAWLKQNGFTDVTVLEEESEGPAGYVLYQSVTPGESVSILTPIVLHVSVAKDLGPLPEDAQLRQIYTSEQFSLSWYTYTEDEHNVIFRLYAVNNYRETVEINLENPLVNGDRRFEGFCAKIPGNTSRIYEMYVGYVKYIGFTSFEDLFSLEYQLRLVDVERYSEILCEQVAFPLD